MPHFPQPCNQTICQSELPNGSFINVHHLTPTKLERWWLVKTSLFSHHCNSTHPLFSQCEMLKLIFGRASKSIRLLHSPALPGVISSAFHIALDHIGSPFKPNVLYLCLVQSKCNILSLVKNKSLFAWMVIIWSASLIVIFQKKDRHGPCWMLSLLLWFHDEFESFTSHF